MRLPLLASACSLVALVAVACADSDESSTPTSPTGPSASPTDGGNADAATAATPITIGQGYRPGVAVDAAGTAYIAWYGPESDTSSLQFCRLPRGATACAIQKAIAAPGTSLSRPFVIVDGSTVRVISYRYGLTSGRFDAVYVFVSSDGGSTFDAGQQIGTAPYNEVAVGPGNAVSLATDAYSFGEVYERAALDATSPPAQRAVLSADHPYSGAVGLIDGTTPLVAFADGSGNAQFRRFGGTGDPNDVAMWSAPQDIGRGEYMNLAGGSSGLFLKARDGAGKLVVRKFDGATFGAAVAIPEGTGELPQSHLTQDPAGRLHVSWPRIDVDGTRLYYATSDDGATWQTARVFTGPDGIADLRLAAAADHIGVAAWDTGPTTKTIRALAIGPR
jgi:hypothetical protein